MTQRASIVSLLVMSASLSLGNGCPPGVTPFPASASLAGLWSLTRGDVAVSISWTLDSGGAIETQTRGGTLIPLDPGDFPPALAPLVNQWNSGLAELNAKLDAALPGEVIVEFPTPLSMRVTNAADPARNGTGLFDPRMLTYVFVGDFSGAAAGSDQGAGAVLSVASVNGEFDVRQLTTTGKIARTLALLLTGAGENGAGFTARITVAYSGKRVGDVPASGSSGG